LSKYIHLDVNIFKQDTFRLNNYRNDLPNITPALVCETLFLIFPMCTELKKITLITFYV